MHLYSTFSVDPQFFSIGANLYFKLRFFAIFAAVGPHFCQNGEIWYDGADLGSLHQTEFCIKKSLKGYTFFGQIYTKIPFFCEFGGSRPTF